MATTGVGFRWLDILEKEFDKACVEVDASLSELDTEDPEVVFASRQKIATLSSCFAQLTHKALTIFQNSAKLEAELVDMRAELVQARAAGGCQDGGDTLGNVPEAARARAEAAQLARENAALRETVLALHSELFGARLATKYLDKELAGRIQQLQLLGSDMRAELRDSLWAQVEAEILLQRHKTLVRVCRGLAPRAPRPPPAHAPPAPRTVRVRRSPHLGLGISVTGGREHGVPILISELEAGGPAALTGELYVGDAILAINDLDLTQACHKEAVQALQSVKGDCALCVQFIATDDDDRLSEDNYRFPLYPEDESFEPDAAGATPTAPRTPDYNHRPYGRQHGRFGARGDTADAPAHYSDYNINSLSILDMDDDSIKIEARLETAGAAASLSTSARSTPVHTRAALKKKRKPQDWRTKGAYCAVSDAQSSDEPRDAAETPNHRPDHRAVAPVSEKVLDRSDSPVSGYKPPSPVHEAPPSAPVGDTELPDATLPAVIGETVTTNRASVTNVTTNSKPLPSPDIRNSADPLPPPLDIRSKTSKTNGDTRARKETKGFRIGSARRVTENGRNGEAERRPVAPRLLPGRGDPDFGTPV
ncbi:Golgi-associated PDZ and coiled-coil motif-containing protein-like [Melitaea cinxia]|uniref:Golgi-associated PDZ and coiled-coil motif-containing protein-like n=1 Tax=Melitaea cinxia TaxID=113334 RepID=UPI001E271EE5|nr:Golgi-associated PDZ and coiled-coil motif-containing protein-like [Melitaea cinxia]